jgi:hypothetical protein
MKLLTPFLLAVVAAVPARSQLLSSEIISPRYEFEARYWLTDLNTQWKYRGPLAPADFDFKNTLGMGDANLPDLRFTYYSKGKSVVRFGYAQASYDGSMALTRPITFNGTAYAAGSQVASHSDFRQFRLSYIYQLAKTRRGMFRFGVLVDGYGFQQKTKVAGSTDGRWFGAPGVGPSLVIRPVRRIEVFAEGSGMGMGRYGFQAGGEAGARVIAFKHITGTVGYRKLRTRPDYSTDKKTEFPYVRLDGMFIGLSGRF